MQHILKPLSATQISGYFVSTWCCTNGLKAPVHAQHPPHTPHRRTRGSAVSHLDDSVVDGGVLFLSQHHQGDDDHGCYDDASDHQADDGALVGAHILCEEDLWVPSGQVISQWHNTQQIV